MPNHPPTRLTARIEILRSRIVALFAALIAVSSLAFALWPRLTGRTESSLAYARLTGLLAILSVLAIVLTWRGLRRWASRLLATSLLLIPTLLVLGFGMPFVPALAAYVGVLMIVAAGSGQAEVLVVTAIVVVLGALAYLATSPRPPTAEALISITGLLGSTGATLSWLGDSLVRAIRELEASEAHFHRLSHLDPLTGLGNRREFDEGLASAVAYCSPTRPVALVVIDVDNLKRINDQLGHPMGDQALQTVSAAIRQSVRDTDIASRIGGDEFGVILPLGGVRGAWRIAQRIREALDSEPFAGQTRVTLSVSLGVAEARDPAEPPESFLGHADAEMYADRARARHPVDVE